MSKAKEQAMVAFGLARTGVMPLAAAFRRVSFEGQGGRVPKLHALANEIRAYAPH